MKSLVSNMRRSHWVSVAIGLLVFLTWVFRGLIDRDVYHLLMGVLTLGHVVLFGLVYYFGRHHQLTNHWPKQQLLSFKIFAIIGIVFTVAVLIFSKDSLGTASLMVNNVLLVAFPQTSLEKS
ncbi:hypothetical protein [Streptococcus ovuberis]|uniref:Uncharacterized protein n=1 Tax=Streptococcus ovuberis TaxID=1936207 RepID=A0A7X6MYK5_9STRE|nr:hypothetical protein [Streptococcus ovuberis]NKZ20138.1 hypothetical protein [Streptococcus ovuberis]